MAGLSKIAQAMLHLTEAETILKVRADNDAPPSREECARLAGLIRSAMATLSASINAAQLALQDGVDEGAKP